MRRTVCRNIGFALHIGGIEIDVSAGHIDIGKYDARNGNFHQNGNGSGAVREDEAILFHVFNDFLLLSIESLVLHAFRVVFGFCV